MKKIVYALLALLVTLGLALAQDSNSHSDHNESDHNESKTHQQHDDTNDTHGDHHDEDDDGEAHDMSDTDSDKEGHDHNSHDHNSDNGEVADEHDGHDTDTNMEAMNAVMLGEQTALVEPLVTVDGNFSLGLRPDSMMTGDLELSATTPSGETVTASETGMNMTLLELGSAEAGVYRVSGSYNGGEFSFPVSLYQQTRDGIDAYLILSPSPTLANRGMTEVFAYAFKDGESIHDDFRVNRSMVGMQHSTDDDQLELSHTHFDDAYDGLLGETPMSNQTAVGFSMVGTWQVDLMITGDTSETLSFDIEMLEN